MLIYKNDKAGFLEDVYDGIIADKINKNYYEKIGKVSPSEFRSWNNSLTHMALVINENSIPNNIGIAIEFGIPNTSKRVDFIITGKDESNKLKIILIELKQWEYAEKVDGKDGIVKTFLGGKKRETIHPSYQAWTYASYLKDFNEDIYDSGSEVYPCAYLHNYIEEDVEQLTSNIYRRYTNLAPIFYKNDRKKLKDFISRYIKKGDNKEGIYLLEHGNIKPSKSLQDAIANMLRGNEEFLMIDDQKVIFEKAMEIALKSKHDNKKRVLIIEGGPGTGKSVIAINLLVSLINKELVAHYVTKNAAPRQVYSSKLAKDMTKSRIDVLFKGSGIYIDSKYNEIDVLIVDEAHRLNKKSGLFANKGENQTKEIINASKCSIFFIDESQRVHIKDSGRINDIKYYAELQKAEIYTMKLESQFRCNGSDGYIAWLDHILEIKTTANFDGFDDYDFRVIDNPNDLFKMIEDKNHNNKARMLAGYCWDWEKKYRDDNSYPDIKIGDFGKSWNLNNTLTWAIDKKSINQIGCIHTSQGLEFEFVGVILGKDIRYEDGKIITDFNERAKTDYSLRGIKKMYKENPQKAIELSDEIIKNTYKTLMSRGQKGCYIYCVDENLHNYFKNKINSMKNNPN